jgi:RNA polymerase sigma-70 factor, ECF subfamily
MTEARVEPRRLMDLVRLFRQALGSRTPADIDARLGAIFAHVERERPDLAVTPDAFVRLMAKHVGETPDVAEAMDALCAADLYVACGCAEGSRAAIDVFDKEYLPSLSGYIARVDPTPDFVAEVRQALRVKMLTREGTKAPLIADYAGRAPLGTWLRVVAVRIARDLLKKDARYVTYPTERNERGGAPAPGHDPEGEFLREESAAQLNRAFERTIEGLDDRDRTLLRLYFVEGMSLAAVGRMYHVHESTILRRINALRDKLLDEVKRELEINSSELVSNMALVRSRLDFHLANGIK